MNQTMICISRFIPSIINKLLLNSIIKWSPTSRGEGWSLRNRVSRVSKGGATVTRRISVNQINKICHRWFVWICFKNICESDKSIVIYIFTVCCFSLDIFQKDQLLHYLILFEYLLKTSVNQNMICNSRFIPSIIDKLLLNSVMF